MRPTRVATAVVAGLVLVISAAPAGAAQQAKHGVAVSQANPRRALAFAAPEGYLFTVLAGASEQLRAAGASPVMAAAGIWQVPAGSAPALRERLVRRGLLLDVSPNARLATQVRPGGDPLVASMYMFGAVGAVFPRPTPRVKLFLVDTGIDPADPDFLHKAPGTVVRANPSRIDTTDGQGEWHGTATASIAAGAHDGFEGEGIFPELPIGEWDASFHPIPASCGTEGCLSTSEVVKGIDYASSHGYKVLNLSLGSPSKSPPMERALLTAFARGTLTVVSAGNAGDAGNPVEYPAAYPHVMSVAATGLTGVRTAFSESQPYNDVAAPGEEVGVSIPSLYDPVTLLGEGAVTACTGEAAGSARWCNTQGTSFSAPITAAAVAWVWSRHPTLTAFQMHNVMRFGAFRRSQAFSPGLGFGMVSIPDSDHVAAKPGARDLQEPNDDIAQISGTQRSAFGKVHPAILRPGRPRVKLTAYMDYYKDYEDVYRVQSKFAGRLKVVLAHPGGDLNVCVWTAKTRTVQISGVSPQLIKCSKQRGSTSDTLVVSTARSPRLVYIDVYVPAGTRFLRNYYTLTATRVH